MRSFAVWTAAWTGNFLLTALAFFLAFSSEGPLSPLLFGAVALCILSGNSLPLFLTFLDYLHRKLDVQAEQQIAAVKVREALLKVRAIDEHLSEVHGASAKAILVGRQIPDRIESSVISLQEAMDSLASRLENASTIFNSVSESKASPKKDEPDSESSIAMPEVPESPPDPDLPEEPEVSPEKSVQPESELPEVPLPPSEPASPSIPSPSARIEKELHFPVLEKSQPPTAVSRITARAMIGIANRLTIRGDGPGLSWDKGLSLELIGIGEYAWESTNLQQTMKFQLYLNDSKPAEGEILELLPGEHLRVQPVFAG